MVGDLEMIEEAAILTTLALPFFLLLLSIEKKMTVLVTTISLCPNCPKRK
jgi:hypothetical protein